ncbi:MAG: ComEC/Rec2 family competence protein, partial [Smithellaceae bacterium]|nr:ComEC/Rec2 family competence protein [Smithellaceae bacterium]
MVRNMPLVMLLLPFVAGIVVASSIPIPNAPILIAIIPILFLLLYGVRSQRRLIIPCLFGLLFFAGVIDINRYLQPSLSSNHILGNYEGEKMILEGTVCTAPQFETDKTEAVILLERRLRARDSIPCKGKILLSIEGAPKLDYGDYVRFKARLKRIHNFQNPGGFDYERYLRWREVYLSASIRSDSDLVVLRKGQGN